MIDNALDTIPENWRPVLVFGFYVFLVVLVFFIIREFWCWYFKTSHIAEDVRGIKTWVEYVGECQTEIRKDLLKMRMDTMKAKLEELKRREEAQMALLDEVLPVTEEGGEPSCQ